MKPASILFLALLAAPFTDFVGTSLHISFIKPAEAAFARRTAFVARGPYGGVAVGARRTAFVGRPGYYGAYTNPCVYPYNYPPYCYPRAEEAGADGDIFSGDAQQSAPDEMGTDNS